ncbi:hypothetical protein ACFFKE_08700 [Streptomyces mutabilis]|uniref:hypothetical protein n=1 Tax=Streptomyces mutabilis TaxID=67332 RepID=UPI00177F6BEB|nr:hypothetical protein [Streptomyces mutabilis]GGQ49583.1 hypothetical protein GCM10010279_68700 [Streptomyces mutabilis]
MSQQKNKKITLIAVPALAAVAVGAVALAATWPESPRESRTPATAPQQPVAKATVGDPDDPATWKLPIEAYLPTQAEHRLVSSNRDETIDACMADAGYPEWTPAPDLPAIGGKTLTDWRYGIHDATKAAERGYHPDAEAQKAYDAAMEEGAVDESNADEGSLRNCVAQADGTVPALPADDLVQQIGGDAFRQAERDPKVVAAFAQWSSCMKDKGYDYVKPMDANDDPQFSDPSTVTDTEIATAKADVACRDKHQVEKTWFDAEAKLQQTSIAQHEDELNQVAAGTRAVVAKAKAAAR